MFRKIVGRYPPTAFEFGEWRRVFITASLKPIWFPACELTVGIQEDLNIGKVLFVWQSLLFCHGVLISELIYFTYNF